MKKAEHPCTGQSPEVSNSTTDFNPDEVRSLRAMPGSDLSMSTYRQWISENVEKDGYGQCAIMTKKMLEAFPELTRVRGHYHCVSWGEREHWWLKTEDGTIVDPTKDQFPSKGTGYYEEWIEGSEEPTGKCPNCGGYVYGNKYGGTCSPECFDEYRLYLEGSMR